MNHLGLFEGIGGFSLAARWMGWKTLAWCEWNEFGQKVLRYHFPEAEGFGDITKTDFRKYANKIDILTGGFPCQPYSVAGKRKGTEDERHLWPEMLRAIREIKPTYVVGENVGGLVSWNGGLVFEQVQSDLEAEGYKVQPFILPACAKNAPHRRDRVWFIAYSDGADQRNNNRKNAREAEEIRGETQSDVSSKLCGNGITTDTESRGQRGLRNESETTGTRESDKPFGSVCGICDVADTCIQGLQGRKNNGGFGESRENGNEQFTGCVPSNWQNFPTQPPIRGRNDGFPTESLRQRIRADSMGLLSKKEIDKIIFKATTDFSNESIKAYGNAIVPQVAFEIFKVINRMIKL